MLIQLNEKYRIKTLKDNHCIAIQELETPTKINKGELWLNVAYYGTITAALKAAVNSPRYFRGSNAKCEKWIKTIDRIISNIDTEVVYTHAERKKDT